MIPDQIGPYRIEGRLGSGGMGEVYRAFDQRLGRSVAIKLLRTDVTDRESADRRFRREARAAAGLSHPSIVQIHDILAWQDRDCIVMELVEGRSLKERLADGPLELAEAIPLLLEITDGLIEAHAKDIVHRDLKAENVMITPSGRAKILDFGLAKWLGGSQSALSVDGHVIGTLHTMSPEQAMGQEVDHRSDFFSLGVLAYQATTGTDPFRGESVKETLARVCMHRQPPARALDPRIPLPLSDLIDRLLEKNPADRPQRAEEIRTALASLQTSRPEQRETSTVELTPTIAGSAEIEALPSPPAVDALPRVGRDQPTLRSRWPWRAAVAVTVLVAVALLAYVGFHQYRRAQAQPLYQSALVKLRVFDVPAAVSDLEAALEIDSTYALAYTALARAKFLLLREAEAREHISLAKRLSSGVSERDRLLIDAIDYTVHRNWPKAAGAYTRLVEHDPQSLDWNLALAEAQIEADRRSEAFVTLERLRKLPGNSLPKSRIELAEAPAYATADLVKAEAFASRAALGAKNLNLPLLRATACLRQARYLQDQGKYTDASNALEEAARLFGEFDHPGGVAQTLELKAFHAKSAGDLDGALALFDSALEIYRNLGSRYSEGRALTSIGTILLDQQAPTEQIIEIYKQAFRIFNQLNDHYSTAATANQLGILFFNKGNLERASQKYSEALDYYEVTGNERLQALMLTNRAEIHFLEGKLQEAEELHRKALALNRKLDDKGGQGYDLLRLATVFAARGDYYVAREHIEKSARLVENEIDAMDAQLTLAEIDWFEGKAAEAIERASQVEEKARTEGSLNLAIRAQALLAQALSAHNREEESWKLLERARQSSATIENQGLGFTVAITTARLQATRARDVDQTLLNLEAITEEAEAAQFILHALEARLAAGEIELAAGRAAAAKRRLEALIRDAEARRIGQIAGRARTILAHGRTDDQAATSPDSKPSTNTVAFITLAAETLFAGSKSGTQRSD